MKSIIQISLDLTDINEAIDTARIALEAGVDWLEAGTPLILAEGLHGMTQALTGAAIAAVAMFLLWSPSIERRVGICSAATLSFCVLGAFFVSAALRSFYGGTLRDAEGGIPRARGLDLNALNFGLAVVLLVAGRLLWNA